MLYEAFPYYQAKEDNHLKLRFKKIQHNLILKERKIKTRRRGEELIEEHQEFQDERSQQFRYFEDISGYSGVSYIYVEPKKYFTKEMHLKTNNQCKIIDVDSFHEEDIFVTNHYIDFPTINP